MVDLPSFLVLRIDIILHSLSYLASKRDVAYCSVVITTDEKLVIRLRDHRLC